MSACTLVIFGAMGDLTARMLVPALYHLAENRRLPDHFSVLGVARRPTTDEQFRDKMREALKERIPKQSYDARVVDELLSRFHYFAGDGSDPSSYPKLKVALKKLDRQESTNGCYLFYLATPPELFPKIPVFLHREGLLQQSESSWKRIVFEKPFGTDYKSAHELNRILAQIMSEDQIYRIDHYLGKETVQNIMALRFGNGILEPLWNCHYVDSVQITVSETLGVESRGPYYDKAGALRDMIPNHLFQLVALIGMEPPNSFSAEDVRDEKAKLLRAILPCSENITACSVRGQYGAGEIGGVQVPAYRNEEKVPHDSKTDTFAALRLEIDNWRWAGVPFYLRTGKRMAQRLTQAVIQFKRPPAQIFRGTSCGEMNPNHLTLKIQPEERIALSVAAKIPGPQVKLGEVSLDFDYREVFGMNPETGYETLLFDVMNGDATLFQRGDQVEAAWKVVQPVLDTWAQTDPKTFPNYPAGSWGPEAAEALIQRDGRNWITVMPGLTPQQPSERRKAA